MSDREPSTHPPVGMALWLLSGGGMVDRIEWLIDNGFGGLSLLQSAMDVDPEERRDAAAAMASAHLNVTYHGNVHHKLTDAGDLDVDFADRMIDDVIWWHENTDGVVSCCSDPINTPRRDGSTAFDVDLNAEHLARMSERLTPLGIGVGIENGFGGSDRFCTADDVARIRDRVSDWPLGMLFDGGHANIHVRSDVGPGGDGIGAYVDELPLEILEVHLCDNLGEQDEHKQLGYGNLDLEDLFRALKKRGFSGMLTIEVCLDILSGRYGSDIGSPEQTDALLVTRDRIIETWTR